MVKDRSDILEVIRVSSISGGENCVNPPNNKNVQRKNGTLNFLENDQLKSRKLNPLSLVPLKLLYYATTDRK